MVVLAKVGLILFWTLLFLLAVLLIFMVLPISYRGRAKIEDFGARGEAFLSWAYGFLGMRIAIEDEARYEFLLFGRTMSSGEFEDDSSEPKGPKEKKKKKKSRKKFSRKNFEIRKLLGIGKSFLSKLLKILGPDYFKVNGRYGFEDPATTGMVSGLMGIVESASKSLDVRLYPEFGGEEVDIGMELYGSFRPGALVALCISTALKKPVRKLIFTKDKSV